MVQQLLHQQPLAGNGMEESAARDRHLSRRFREDTRMSLSRILKTNTKLIRAEAEGRKARFASESGLHISTLNNLLEDSWDRIERDTIERVCDRLQCGLADLFSLERDNFWLPILNASSCYIIRGEIKERQRKVKTFLEENAKSTIADFLTSRLRLGATGYADAKNFLATKAALKYVRAHNCCVIGAHASNRAFEYVITGHFGATAFDSSLPNRQKLPFRFVRRPNELHESAFVEPWRPDLGNGSGLGIFSEDLRRLIVEIDWRSEPEYREATIEAGKDAALVLVVNRPFAAERDIKLIVLAGFSQLGTHAAAQALIEDYRNLEPVAPRTFTIGVLEVRYHKAAGTYDRRVDSYEWVYLQGGRRELVPSA